VSGPRPGGAPARRDPLPPDGAAQAAALVAVLAALGALWATALVPAPACLLAAVAGVGAVAALRFVPALHQVPGLRVAAALALLAAVTLTGSRAAPDLALVVPFEIIPTGLLAVLAAGALVASVLEFGTARGLRFGVVLTGAVLGLTAALAPGPRMVPALCVGWPAALFALARANGVEGLARSRTGGPQAGPAVRAMGRWHVVPGVASIAVACLALVLLRSAGVTGDGGPGSPTSLGDQGGFQGAAESRRAVRSANSYLGATMDLRMRGTLADTPIFEVPADSPALWRSGVLDRYEGSQWSPTGGAAADRPQLTRQAGGLDLSWPSPVAGVPREDVVRPRVSWTSVVVAAGRPDAVRADELGRSLTAVPATGERLILYGPGATPSYQVTATPLPRVADPGWAGPLAAVSRSRGAGEVDARFTRLPGTVPQRVRELGRRLVASAPDRRAAVLAVEAELRARLVYRLDSPRPPRGEDPVDDVLFRSHAGFCEQFASAEVVLLRSAGIPARMATGFAAGDVQEDRRVLRASDAHAWVEVWFPGVGWVSSDPTAGARRATDWWSDLAAIGRRLVGNPWLLGIAVLVVLGAVSLGVVALVRRRRSRGAETGPVRAPGRQVPAELAAAFARLEAALAEAGRARHPTETVAALGSRIEPGDVPLQQAFDVLERALYAKEPPTRAECGHAASTLDRVSTSVLAEARG
jgi:transglutaminase-like putative cysteine protease